MTADEICEAALVAEQFGYGTVVLQAGEDYGLTQEFICTAIRRIKDTCGLAVTLSLGERPWDELEAFRAAGADRYLLRFETSDPELYARIHPSLDTRPSDRFADLRRLRELGYEVGSGVMVGIPGQTYDILAQDIETFRDLDLDMVGIGPYIPHPNTPRGRGELPVAPAGEQVPQDLEMTYKAVALTRILCPEANLPTTTAVTTVNAQAGRKHGLERGANVVMPNLTPLKYRALYEIYPSKAGVLERPKESDRIVKELLHALRRPVGNGPGNRLHDKDDSSQAA
jgi:biotin synthase